MTDPYPLAGTRAGKTFAALDPQPSTLNPLADASFLWDTLDAFRPAERIRTLDWAVENGVNEVGRPFDYAAYPHMGAPGGPFDAWDDPRVRDIWLQFATRCGKTFGTQTCFKKTAHTDPGPMLLASSTEQLALRVTERFYKMLRHPRFDLLIKSQREQRQNHVEMTGCDMRVAWARSPSTLGDLNAKYGHANEIDKWEHLTTSKEAHPLELFADRFKDLQSVRKVVYEGTPTIKGKSAVERGRLSGWNCSYLVPCPHCRQYQKLEFDRVEWEKPGGQRSGGPDAHGRPNEQSSGKSDPDQVEASASYRCRHCSEPIGNESRAWMMRRGVWIPEGADVDHDAALAIAERGITRQADVAAIHSARARDAEFAKLTDGIEVARAEFEESIARLRSEYEWRGWDHAEWIVGQPHRNGPVASYQLGSLYALSLNWGDVARKFVTTKDRPALLRNFITQWLAETWEITERDETWETLGQRLITDTPRNVVPRGYSLLTIGIDKQLDFYVWVVDAWRPPIGDNPPASHTVAYGFVDEEDELDEVLARRFDHADGGEPLPIRYGLFDSGYRPKNVYAYCKKHRRHPQLLPCKGSSTKLDSYFRKTKLGKNTSAPGQPLVLVDTVFTQDHLDRQLYEHTPAEGGTTLFAAPLGEHQEFLEQVMNDAAVPELDKTNNVSEKWQRIDETLPNDLRDAKRYALVAMLALARGRIPQRKTEPSIQKPKAAPRSTSQRARLAPVDAKPPIVPGAT